jgi:hypothetical protein
VQKKPVSPSTTPAKPIMSQYSIITKKSIPKILLFSPITKNLTE